MNIKSIPSKMIVRRTALLLAVLLMSLFLSSCVSYTINFGQGGDEEGPEDQGSKVEVTQGGEYDSKEEVAAYIKEFGELPENYITKKEARDLGWRGGSLEDFAPGMAIGGDRFGNREKKLPEKNGRTYFECDIDTIGEKSRGPKRIVYSNDGLIYYTEDHYNSFHRLE